MTDNRETLHDLLCAEPMLAAQVAHHAAHQLVHSVDAGDHAEMRADIERELIELAGDA